MTNLDHTYALILAGGGGTRLWPKSRHATPKQFLKLLGKQTMLQMTADRFSQLVPWDHIIIITNKAYQQVVQEQLPLVPPQNILPEPDKRDTALAMLVGARYAQTLDPEAVVVNDAADHPVANVAECLRVMRAAARVASDPNHLVAVGITPTEPSTAFGYIKVGQELKHMDRSVSVFQVESFTEKPNQPTARAFIATGKYFWNANMYVWSVKALIQAFATHMPKMLMLTDPLVKLRYEKFVAALPAIYKKATAISIDYAISEKVNNLVLIPGDFGWNDIGEWKVVYDLSEKDHHQNVILSDNHSADELLALDSTHNLIHTNGRLVALLGLHDMIVVDTPDIVLVAPKSKSQDVKKLVETLKEQKQTKYL